MRPGMKALLMTARRGNERGGERGNDRGGHEYNYPRNGYEGNYPREEYRGGEGNYRSRGNRSEYEGRDYNRMEYNGSGMNYGGVEGRFRDRRGREHYDNGRFAPMRNYGGEARGERREGNDRTRPSSGGEGDDDEYDYPGARHYPYPTPWYDREEGGGRPMNKIGFSLEGAAYGGEYRQTVERPEMNEMEHRRSEMHRGGAMTEEFNRETADQWMAELQNEDGTTGPHWTYEQVRQAMSQKGLQGDPIEYYVVMNMMYSDYCGVAKKLGVNKLDFYTEMSKAFLQDKDAPDDKLARYYECIVNG